MMINYNSVIVFKNPRNTDTNKSCKLVNKESEKDNPICNFISIIFEM